MNAKINRFTGMFNRVLPLMVILSMLSSSIYAQIIEEQRTDSSLEARPQEQNQLEVTYEDEIKENEVPENILLSVKDNYDEYKINRSHRGSDGSYRIALVKEDEKIFVFYSAAGDFQRIEQEAEDASINDDWR